MKNVPKSGHFFEVLYLAISFGVVAVLVALLGNSSLGLLLGVGLLAYGFFGNFKFGITQPSNRAELMTALRVSVIWPALWWKAPVTLDGPDFYVRVNGVDVGSLSRKEYAEIVHEVLHDPFVIASQLGNCVWVAVCAFNIVIVNTPAVVFYGGVAFAIMAPHEFQAVIAAIYADPARIASGLADHWGIFVELWVAALVGEALVVGRVIGFTNRFRQTIGRHIRILLGVPATGELILATPSHSVGYRTQR